MDKFEQKELKKIIELKNTLYDLLINYIPEPIRKNVHGFKDKIVNLFNANKPKQIVYERRKKLSKAKTQNEINSIRNPFIIKKKKNKDRIMWDIRTVFEQEKETEYYKPKRVSNF